MARSIGQPAEALEAIGTADGDLEEAAMMLIRIPPRQHGSRHCEGFPLIAG